MSTTFIQPDLEYVHLWPLFVVFGAACVGVLVEAFVARSHRFIVQVWLMLVALTIALAGTIWVGFDLPDGSGTRGIVGGAGSLALDGPAIYIQGVVLVCALAGTLLFAERRVESGVTAFAGSGAAAPGSAAERATAERDHTEVFPLLGFAVLGMLVFPAANDLVMLFIALEVVSLPLYVLTGLARRRRLLSQEAALKYFLLGAFSSAFLLYGAALVYGATGTMKFSEIWQVASASQGAGESSLLIAGIALIAVGLLFKVGAVPFQAWTPDVYQGAPTPVVAFMAAGTKIAAFGALLRLFTIAFAAQSEVWRPLLWAVAIATMLVGAIVALVQTDLKRMLGYSAVTHSGFVLAGMVGVGADGEAALGGGEGLWDPTSGVLFYLTAYAVAVIGGFALISLVRDSTGEASRIRDWNGLGRRHPWLGIAMVAFMLSLAGLPPTVGFIAKLGVIASAASADAWLVVGAAIVSSVIALVAYLRVIVVLYFRKPTRAIASGRESRPIDVVTQTKLTNAVVAVAAVATLVLGLVPGPLLELISQAGGLLG